tara:strand:- start:198 stop:539 length:342 start_codon:yes stop_codon:yes gene_type:complete
MKYYHNNRCRKSREGLAFLNEKDIHPEVINYMTNKINKADLLILIEKLQLTALDLIRKNESFYKENIKGKSFTNEELIDWMIKEPKLIERPILENDNSAEIGRPKENFLSLIS